MNIYTLEPINKATKKSIYLAGPTYRPDQGENASWRAKALQYITGTEFQGDVYIPEYSPKTGMPADWTYSRQVSWELDAMNHASVILFWIPRDMKTLPGLTTNIEFGEWMHSEKLVVGFPEKSDNNRYIKYRCELLNIPFFNTLYSCVTIVVANLIGQAQGKSLFTADNHFGHERTLELSKRPFLSVKEMDWTMVGNWNAIVSDEDTVYHLGDFGDPEMAKYLNGNIKLLPGNYDTEEVQLRLVKLGVGRYGAPDGVNMEKLVVDSHAFSIVHEPTTNNGQAMDGTFMLFAHVHKLCMIKRNGLNVGVDCHNFTPIDMDTVVFYKNAVLNHYDENVFC